MGSLLARDATVYERAGCLKFRDYIARAEELGLVELGGSGNEAWVGLNPDWVMEMQEHADSDA